MASRRLAAAWDRRTNALQRSIVVVELPPGEGGRVELLWRDREAGMGVAVGGAGARRRPGKQWRRLTLVRERDVGRERERETGDGRMDPQRRAGLWGHGGL